MPDSNTVPGQPDDDREPDQSPVSPASEAAASDEPASDEPALDETGLDLAHTLTRSAKALARARTKARLDRRSPRRAELSGAHPDGRDPTLVGDVVDKMVTEHGWSADLAVHGVFGRWSLIVGDDVAAHCHPESFADGRLRVRTDSTAWATQLRLLAPTVVRRLNEELGHDTVTVIDVAGPDAPSWAKGRRSARDGRGPRDTYG